MTRHSVGVGDGEFLALGFCSVALCKGIREKRKKCELVYSGAGDAARAAELPEGSSFRCLSPLLPAGTGSRSVYYTWLSAQFSISWNLSFFSLIISTMIAAPASTEGDGGSQGASSTAKHCPHGNHWSFLFF